MGLLIGFLNFILVVNCLFLVLLILVQLPKKEAGAGIAFGGAATDALFGAGSGNVLTKMTKYAASLFLGMALLLAFLNSQRAGETGRRLERELQKKTQLPSEGVPLVPATNLPLPSTTAPASTNTLMTTPSTPPAVNPPAKAPAPAPKKK